MKLQLEIPDEDVGELNFALYQAMNAAEDAAALWFSDSQVMLRDALTRLHVCYLARQQIRKGRKPRCRPINGRA